jgi:uncharacterized protein with HEPN domain
MKDDQIYLDHILECLKWIKRYTVDGRETFFADRKTQCAVLRELQTMAESTQRLSKGLKDAHPEVFWQGIAGFRNLLVHDYLGIRLERVWEVVEHDVPVLMVAVQSMLIELGGKNLS